MRVSKFALVFAAFTFMAGTSLAAVVNAAQPPASQDQAQNQDPGQKQELVVTVVSVDPKHKTIQVEEAPGTIMVASETVYDPDVQLDKLRAGIKIKVVGIPSPDGKQLQASEIHAAPQ
jgi:hypothetical protein